ncbi:TIGR01244 family sulfur transferase [Cognatishimia activa]|uniref:TIGR01244 family sulfur transferase n=1 Tax=Cognatishimia activa TaxID=1715691 RepID=UPI00222F1DF8|nr:TIGR01244 family sulfur transferase [Cognatishimia activa]UZD91678.1 TIGR01244 family sulfur transferase [Cognatishimia activa]
MDIREITPRYSVSPQIAAEDIPEIVAAGYTCVICNRPDVEIPPSHHATVIEAAAKAAGLDFIVNPLTHETMTADRLQLQRQTLEGAEGKVLAYCASGTRSTVAWMFGHADTLDADTLLNAAAAGGYHLEALRPQLEYLSQS